MAVYPRSCANRRGVPGESPHRRRSRPLPSPEQIHDQLLRLLVVPENLWPDALDADQAGDRLVVLALSSVGNGSFEMNLAPAPHEARGEPVGVDLVGDLHRAVGPVQTHGDSQRVGADVRRAEAGPRVVAVRAKAHGEALGVSEIPAGGRFIILSGCGDRRDEQQGAPHRDNGRVSVAHRGQVIGTDDSNLFGVGPFATSLEGAGQLVGGRPLQTGDAL